ncbi:SMI1/KNR4 family protein [Streptomyces sp. NPDC057909]|uniref:SMI1/KNR4 family protein n=1 Tax=Streptomyces sp. NPDC057909 TaxID=3346277 RepID=UPI0036DFBAB5
MLADHQEYDVVVTAVAPVGVAVHADGHDGFIDQTKHPSWWSDTPRAAVGDRMRAVVLDASRTPPRFSALPSDRQTARSLRHAEPLVRLSPSPGGGRTVKWSAVEEALGIALPADYKRLVQMYGGGLFAGVLRLLEPGCPNAMYDLVAQTAEREEILAELREAGEGKPSELHPRSCVGIPAFRPGGKRILRPGAAKRRSTLRSCFGSGQGLAVMRPSAVK